MVRITSIIIGAVTLVAAGSAHAGGLVAEQIFFEGGGHQATPQSLAGTWPDNQIVILQTGVDPDPGPGPGPSVIGTMGLLTIVDGQSAEVAGNFTFGVPAPPALSLLALAAVRPTRRRDCPRRSAASPPCRSAPT